MLVGVSLIGAYLFRNRYHHGLNKYPGPVLASLTDWWRFWDVINRRPDITHIKLHEKNGDVVRLGPNTLSFADPAALKTIYGLNKGFVKVIRAHYLHSTPASLTDLWVLERLLCRSAGRSQGTQPSILVQHDRQ